MNGRTQLLIGVAVVLLGVGVVALAFVEDESGVRRVEEVIAQPGKHSTGSYVLLGVPQPPEVPVTTDTGVSTVANPEWTNTTTTGEFWGPPSDVRFSLRTVTVRLEGDSAHWTWRNETKRTPADTQLLGPAEERTWVTEGARTFAIRAFDSGQGEPARIWGLYDGPLKDPMQPKPSQFTGRLLAALPDGSPVPEGAFLYDVQEFKAGCSSKFLPPEEKARLEDSGDL